jgi:MoaA/NifB/PqqE/SkfB family radical SAM enzyme
VTTAQSAPVRASLDVTYACDLRCIHCRTNAGEIPAHIRRRMLDTDQLAGLMRDLDALETFEITLTGGEPTIRKDFWRLLDVVADLRFSTVTLITNAVNLTPARMDAIMDAGISSVRVSIDGTREVYERIRLVDAFDRVLDNAEYFNSRLGNVKILTSVMRENLRDVFDLAAVLRRRGIRRQDLILVRAHGRGARNNLLLTESEVLVLARRVGEFASVVPVTDFELNLNAPYLIPVGTPSFQDIVMYPYTVRDTSIAISATGDVTMSRLYSSAPIGNVKDASVGDIWRNAHATLRDEPNQLTTEQLRQIFWNFDTSEGAGQRTSLLDRQIFDGHEVR